MSRSTKNPQDDDAYQNDYRLIQAYQEATNLDEEGFEALCPSYIELSETSTRYQDETLIGKGGVKEVCRTFDNHTRRWLAMARLRPDHGPEFYDLFVHEAWLTSSLNHPNIISVHDVGIDPSGHPFFTMDLKGDTTLDSFIKGSQRELHDLLRDFLKICDAVSYAHSKNILHLDLKPENIQTDAFGEVLVCDWGLGKIISDPEGDSPDSPSHDLLDNMTLVGQIKGTPGYMAPEQIAKDIAKDPRTDVFSLGCILHAILTDEPPFRGDHEARLAATSEGNVADPCQKFPSRKIPLGLGAVTLKALTKDPSGRYQSVSELKKDVLRYMEGFSPKAEETHFLREAFLFASRNRIPVFVAFFSMILLSVLSTLFVQRLDFLQQSVREESHLADHYATAADAANQRHLDALSKSQEEQRALSQSLMSSVKNLKSKGVFDTPMKSIREAVVLAEHSLALNPDSEAAKFQLFALNSIQLNFKGALEFPLPEGHARHGYMSFAQAFPEFDYHREKRPSLEALCDFLEKARTLDPNHRPIIERMISYDAAVRPSKKSYHQVVLELINYLNPSHENIELKPGLEESELTLRSLNRPRLIVNRGGSEQCVLRYLNVRNLTLESPSVLDLAQLNGLTIQKLDLTGCARFRLKQPLSLPALDTIIIKSGHHSIEELRTWIRSSGDFEIIEAS